MITTFGEIMLRISPENSGERIIQAKNYRIEPGGSESNVAIALANLGLEATFLTKLPDNELKNIVLAYLHNHKVQTNVAIGGERLGSYWTETGIGPRNSFVIYDRKKSAFSEIKEEDFQWESLLKNSRWFHFSGISPAVSKSVAHVLQTLVENNFCPYSIDLNYRKKLWDWVDKNPVRINGIMSNLCKNAELIAGNESDFYDIFGVDSKEKNDDLKYREIAQKAFHQFPKSKYISISNRESISATHNNWSGYLFVNNNQEIKQYKGLSYSIDHVIDRVGTGDSFVAGIIYGLNQFEKDYQKTIDFAVTLAALNHTIKGDASYFSTEDVLQTMKSKGTGRIIR